MKDPACFSGPEPTLPPLLQRRESWQEGMGRDPGVQPRRFLELALALQKERNLPWDFFPLLQADSFYPRQEEIQGLGLVDAQQ